MSNETKIPASEYLRDGKHLPADLKDFHDQKDVFKAIESLWGKDESYPKIGWPTAHCYTIDIFLHYMGLHGYKLQKIRAKDVDFYDLNDTISDFKKTRSDEFNSILSEVIERRKANEIP